MRAQSCPTLCPWDSPGKNPGVGCDSLLHRVFPTQGAGRFFTSEPSEKPLGGWIFPKYLFHLPSILRCKVTSRKSDHQKNPKKNEILVLLQTLSTNLAQLQWMQLVCGQDLRSFVRNTYVRLLATLECASEGHLCLEFRV